ncbi:MAG: ABC transporter permease [Lachnospiraceae bacterium]
MRVANRKCICRLSMAHMRSVRNRNLITILAIVLTTVLFTALFTAGISLKEGFEQANFRQAGGYNHAVFKNITQEQFDDLKEDPLIKEYGDRLYVGMPMEAPFHKNHVEVNYYDGNSAKWSFCTPVEGRLPEEGTNEAATDTTVLKLLGVEPVIGNSFTMTFNVDGALTTETFTLSGYWEYDTAMAANNVVIPRSRAEEIFEKLGTEGKNGMCTYHTMNLMFESAFRIQENLQEILDRHGYQDDKPGAENYIATGVNWGYVTAQMGETMDPGMMLALAAALLLIMFTGHLIINNIFRIAVSNDVRFYGLLKTIGTTGRQIKRIIVLQAAVLSAIGIPVGAAAGYVLGIAITRITAVNMDGITMVRSIDPLIFIGASAFSLITVFLSCGKPRRMAAKVSPIEALRYTEGYESKKKQKKGRTGASVPKMAWANLGRNKSKTVISVISMSLAIVILDMTHVFTGGFDMDKYLRDVTQDFLLAEASYFQVNQKWRNRKAGEEAAVSEEAIAAIERQGGITGGKAYGTVSYVEELVTEERAREMYGNWRKGSLSGEDLDYMVDHLLEHVGDKRVLETRLYGMEEFLLDKLVVIDGDLSRLKEGGNYVAAVYDTDDYHNLYEDWHWAKVGDQVTLRYVDVYEYYNPQTGEVYPENVSLGSLLWAQRAKAYREETYEVVATVVVPNTLTYRFYGDDEYVMNADTFKEHTGTDAVLYYAFDCADEETEAMEQYLREYTQGEGEGSFYDYESKTTRAQEFYELKNMFLFVGTAVSLVVGLIGVLNFLNAVLTGILTRKKEFAVLQSVGMTGKQLNIMLITEGLLFAGGTVAVTLALVVVMGPLIGRAMEGMFWFFTYRIDIMPILAVAPFFLLLGVLVPLMSYRYVAKRSVVERLREAE